MERAYERRYETRVITLPVLRDLGGLLEDVVKERFVEWTDHQMTKREAVKYGKEKYGEYFHHVRTDRGWRHTIYLSAGYPGGEEF